MDKIFLFNENSVCTNQNIPVSWIGDNTSMGCDFKVFTAYTSRGWIGGFSFHIGKYNGYSCCDRDSNILYATQKETIYKALVNIEKFALAKAKGKVRKELLSEIRKYINMYDIRQLELFN